LVTPEQEVLDAPVIYASVPAHDGQIGIMHDRAPLLVKLGDGALRLDDAAGQSRWFLIAGGFAQMKENRLTILTDKAIAAEELNEEEAKAALAEALAFVPQTDEQHARKQRDLDRARATLTLIAEHGSAGKH
jgi:F-type H+-transporting ATPase subunit epsilon